MRHPPARGWQPRDDPECSWQIFRPAGSPRSFRVVRSAPLPARDNPGRRKGGWRMTLPTVVYLLVVLAPVSPLITVLKPVKGDEPGLYENLASLARQDYPAYEILIGADDARDPALATAREVQEDFPQVPIGIHVGARQLGLNPKVNLLSALFDRARHDAVLISDSNVRVGPEYLREMAAEMADPAVGLVTNMVVGDGAGVGALLETLHLNSFVVAATSLARVAAGR